MIERLSGKREFERLRSEGYRMGHGPLRLVWRPDEASPPRMAFAIPRNVGNAVARNRTKRRLRAVMSDVQVSNPTGIRGGDYLLRVTASVDRWSYDELRSRMTDLLVNQARKVQE